VLELVLHQYQRIRSHVGVKQRAVPVISFAAVQRQPIGHRGKRLAGAREKLSEQHLRANVALVGIGALAPWNHLGPGAMLAGRQRRWAAKLQGFAVAALALLKRQDFLITQGKHIVPTEAGLSLFGVLKQADPALVDPGVTAQLECLLDDVVVGKQEMVSAIDAVCDLAQRIIGKLKDGAAPGGAPLLGAAGSNGPVAYPPTPAMKRFADILARQKGIKPPPGYKTSISICSAFLKEHAPKKAESEASEKLDTKPISPAQMLYAKKIAQGKGVVIPEEAKANSAAMSQWIDSNRSAKRRKRGVKTAYKVAGAVAAQSAATTKRSRKRKADAAATPHPAPSAPAKPNSISGTPLRIPYGNKELALKLGARYRSGGWYAPPGVDLSAFRARGWL
jgi:DNA topoisomerase III